MPKLVWARMQDMYEWANIYQNEWTISATVRAPAIFFFHRITALERFVSQQRHTSPLHTRCYARMADFECMCVWMRVAVINGCALSEIVVCNFNKHYRHARTMEYIIIIIISACKAAAEFHTHTHCKASLDRNSLHFTFVRLWRRANFPTIFHLHFFFFAHLKKSRLESPHNLTKNKCL